MQTHIRVSGLNPETKSVSPSISLLSFSAHSGVTRSLALAWFSTTCIKITAGAY